MQNKNARVCIWQSINILKYFQNQYFERYPKGLNPVQINDIFFSLHAVFATVVTIGQCFIYEVTRRNREVILRQLLKRNWDVIIFIFTPDWQSKGINHRAYYPWGICDFYTDIFDIIWRQDNPVARFPLLLQLR